MTYYATACGYSDLSVDLVTRLSPYNMIFREMLITVHKRHLA